MAWWDDYQYLMRYLPMFLSGMRVTAEVSVLGFCLGMVIGLLGAAARGSRLRVLRVVSGAYVEVILNTPTLVQIFLVFFGLPSLGIRLSNYQAGVVALGISGGGYLVEILRAGFQAVARGQSEAATTLGLSRWHAYRFVIAPQALRIVYPPVVGQFIQMILGSSMLSIVGLPELTGQAQLVNLKTFLTMQTFIIALVCYLVLANVVSLLAALVGRVVFHPPVRAVTTYGVRRLRVPLSRKAG